jgi:type I restriction enzyme S subunit
MSEWQETTLGEVIDFTTGRLNSNAAVIDGKYPFFTCSPETLKIDIYAFDCKAILLAGNNANGQYPLKIYEGKFNAYQRTYVITPKKQEKIDLDYLYYLLNIQLNYFKEISQGSATKFLTAVILKNLSLELPPVSEQKKIAAVLSCLDHKIENLRKQNETLEVMAQTLFKHWFVDFEFPNEDGKPYKSSGGEMVRSELGEIPAGWRVGELGDVADVKSSKRIFLSEYVEFGIPFYRSKEIIELSSGQEITTPLYISEERFREIESKFGAPEVGEILVTSVGTIGVTYIVSSRDKFYFKDGNLTYQEFPTWI